MPFQPSLLLPLACALLYVVAALAIKRAAAFGVGVWRTNFVSNWAIVLLFVPVWFARGHAFAQAADYARPAATALLFFGGQAFTFLALNRGDVSVTTPVMGAKVVLVALFSSLLRVGSVPLRWWIAAALSTLAIALLHGGDGARRRNVGETAFLAFCSATSFGLGDVLLQKWLPIWGLASFLPPMFLMVGLLSVAFVPLFKAPLRELDLAAWRWVGTGALLLAVNNAGVVLALVLVGSATVVNIIYSARGLFSVVLVWAIGHWFASEEQHLGGAVLRLRFIGAGLMVAAIALVLV
ncbi:MAG TPA: DMT family transporter [Lacunisphaera sp.]|jgi:drug/metabolite transporter (DMT)-like permease|nr:DMT family transporter [Lacunisphaera sp.]